MAVADMMGVMEDVADRAASGNRKGGPNKVRPSCCGPRSTRGRNLSDAVGQAGRLHG